MDKKTRNLLTMYFTLYPRDDIDQLYVLRKEGWRRLACIEDSVNRSKRQVEDNKKSKERLITATKNNTNNKRVNRTTITTQQKQLYGHFKRQTSKMSHEKIRTWLRKGNFKRETESLLITAQDNVIRTNYIKSKIDKIQQNSKCRLCGDRDETIKHIK